MAWAPVQSRSTSAAGAGTTLALAYTSNVVAGDLLTCFCEWGGATLTTTVADSQGNTWTPLASTLVTAGALRGQLFWAKAGSSAANTVTMTTSASSTERAIFIFEGSGFDTTAPVDAQTTGTGSTANPSTNITPTADPAMIFAGVITSGSCTAGAGYTDIGVANGDDAEYRGSTGLTAQAAVFVGVASTWGISAATFKETPSTGDIIRRPILEMLRKGGLSRARALLLIQRAAQPVVTTTAAVIPLETATGTSTAALVLTAPTTVPLDPTAGQSAATLALSATTQVPLGASAATSTGTLALTAPAQLRLAPNYATEVLADSPSGYWRFGESSGTNAVDASTGGHAGTYQGGFTLGATGALRGDTDTAVTLDGTSTAMVTVPNLSLTSPFSLEAWAFCTGAGSIGATDWGTVFGYSGTRRILFDTTGINGHNLLVQMGGANLFTAANSAPANTWLHIVYTYNGTTERIYINGAEAASQATASGPSWNSAFQIGAYANPSVNYAFKGTIDEPAVYSVALSPAAVARHFNAGLGAGSSGQSTATLALTVGGASGVVPLDPAAATSTATLALTAPTQVPLGTSAAASSATLALSAKTTVVLGTSAATSTGTLALSAQTQVALGTSAAVSTATLALTAQTRIPLGTSAATSTAALALTAQTRVALGTAAAQSAATLALTAQTFIPLGTSSATSTGTLTVTAGPGVIPLQTAAATSTATLALMAKTQVPLGTSTATSSATLTVSTPTQTFIALDTAIATSTGTLALRAPTRVTLQASAAISTAALTVFTPTAALVVLGAANANSTASLVMVQMGRRWPGHTGTRWPMDTETHWTTTPETHWATTPSANRWPLDPATHW